MCSSDLGEHNELATIRGSLDLRDHRDIDGELADPLADAIKNARLDALLGWWQ